MRFAGNSSNVGSWIQAGKAGSRGGSDFFKPKEKRPKMLENLRNIFYKMELSDKETRILSGVFASLAKKR